MVIHRPRTKVTQIKHFQTSFPEKPLTRLKPNLIWVLHGMGERKFVQMIQVTYPRWPPCTYMVKHETIFFSGTERPMILIADMQHKVLEYYQVCSNDDCELNMTYFMARSNFVHYAFVWEES